MRSISIISKKRLAVIYLFSLLTAIQSAAQPYPFAKAGTFMIGCNYWASHAGTHTWSNWKPEVVEDDFKQLSENGIKVLRLFPLWPDFQPIHQNLFRWGRPEIHLFRKRTAATDRSRAKRSE